MINIYDIPEGFGLVYPQAMKAGVICIVSNVGAVSEIIQDGDNGFLIHHPNNTDAAFREVHDIILYLYNNRKFMAGIRRNAMHYNRGWEDVARDFLSLFRSFEITR